MNPGAAFHVINNPNFSGLACNPQLNAIVVNGFQNGLQKTFFHSNLGGSGLPQNIVVAPPAPDTVFGSTFAPLSCFADSLTLIADEHGSCYHWDNDSMETQRTVRKSGTYYVSYFMNCNYTTDTYHVKFINLPILFASPSCPGMHRGNTIAFTGNTDANPLYFIWRQADGSIIRQYTGSGGDTAKGLDSGAYSVQISSQYGCDTTLTFSISNLVQPAVIALPSDTTIRYGDSIMLTATGALFYAWSPSGSLDSANKSSPIARPLKPTIYEVIGIGANGCEDTAYVKVELDYTMPDFVPNAFSPNGDGLNDMFRISGITYQKVAAFRIFNRFGQEIFSTTDGQQGWDGTQNGKPCDIGTYYYFIQLDYPDGKRKVYKGDVLLLR